MTPQELKLSILGQAFRGRLVPQMQGEYVDDIFGFALEETPFEVPDTWRWQFLGKCCEMYTGNSISEHEKATKYAGLTSGYDYIATKDVSFKQEITYDNGVRIPFDAPFKHAHKGAILMCI